MKLIDGKKIAEDIREDLKKKVSTLSGTPGLGIILVGDDTASHTYVGLKEEAAKEIGIHFEKFVYPSGVSEQEVVDMIQKLNGRDDIHGVVVQFPLPSGLQKETIITAIAPEKDVDGFRPDNIDALLAGNPRIIPGLAAGIVKLIKSTDIDIEGKRGVIIARSNVFIDPLSYLLKHEGVAVSSCDPYSDECEITSSAADILIVALGEPGFVKGTMVKNEAIVIDVGYSKIGGKSQGDVDYDAVKDKASWLTPVPGGVGPVTVAMLLANVVEAYENHSK